MIIVNALKGFTGKGIRDIMELKYIYIEFLPLCIFQMVNLECVYMPLGMNQ